MKVKTEVSVNADAEVIVHDEDLCVVLVRGSGLRVGELLQLLLVLRFVLWVENYSPPVQTDFLRI